MNAFPKRPNHAKGSHETIGPAPGTENIGKLERAVGYIPPAADSIEVRLTTDLPPSRPTISLPGSPSQSLKLSMGRDIHKIRC